MYIMRAQGRYGNQFFQAIFCRYCELILKKTIKYDYPRLKWHFGNGYEPGKYLNLKIKKATIPDKLFTLGVNGIELPPRFTKPGKWIEQYEKLKKENKVIVLHDHEDFITKENFNYYIPKDNVMIDSYFFNHRYFFAIKDIIEDELVFKTPLDEKNSQLASDMERSESVAVHIRQGDYKTLPDYDICGKDYYRMAIEYIREKLNNPFFYVFSQSDVEEYMPADCQYIFIDHNTGTDSHKDVQLMTHCHHMIIANSSFSYMAALLNPFDDKIVVMPEMYTKECPFTAAPPSWKRIPI